MVKIHSQGQNANKGREAQGNVGRGSLSYKEKKNTSFLWIYSIYILHM